MIATRRSAVGLACLLLCAAAAAAAARSAEADACACVARTQRYIDDTLHNLKDDILVKLAQVSIEQFRLQLSLEIAVSGLNASVGERLGALEAALRSGGRGACARSELADAARELAAVAERLAERQRAAGAARAADLGPLAPQNATSEERHNITGGVGAPLAAARLTSNVSKHDASEPAACAAPAAAAPAPRADVWREGEAPAEDELDTFMVSHSGCSYRALEPLERLHVELAYEGALRWRLAARARDRFVLHVSWSWDSDYYFFIGDTPSDREVNGFPESEQVTKLFQAAPWRKLQERATPAVLAADRYAPFEVTVREGVLALGAGCGGAPLMSLAVDVRPPDAVMIQMYSFSDIGAKFVYNCSAPAAD